MNKKVILLIIFVFFIINLKFISSATFIVGNIGNATDGTNANGYIITAWNETNGISQNRTDIIGESGSSATSNYYMIDCELLTTPCVYGDNISIQVFDNGSNYTTNFTSVVISGAVNNAPYIQLIENITLITEIPSVSGGGQKNIINNTNLVDSDTNNVDNIIIGIIMVIGLIAIIKFGGER